MIADIGIVKKLGESDRITSLGSVAITGTVGPAKGTVSGGVEFSSKNGVSVEGQATVNGVGVKVNQNGVAPVAGKSADHKLGGNLGLGAAKAGVSLNQISRNSVSSSAQ